MIAKASAPVQEAPTGAGLAAYAFAPLYQDGVLTTLRGTLAGQPAVRITTAATASQAAEAVLYLNNEYALRERLAPSWALVPRAIVWHNGAMALLYDDDGDVPLSQAMPAAGDVDAFLALAIGASAALRALHAAGLLHRNIKPANLLLAPDGRCRLGGFGVAASKDVAASGTALQAGVVRGTPAYMSPEQTGRLQLPVDARSDLYALGVTLYEVLTGRLPFGLDSQAGSGAWMHAHLASEPAPPHRDVPAMPAMLSRIVLKLLAKDPAERYQRAGALEADLLRCREQWRAGGHIGLFAPAVDRTVPLRFGSSLHGREVPLGALASAYARVLETATAQVVFVHGPSGVGKSALLAQFLREEALRAACVASAKADQFSGAAPYVTLAAALRSLVLCILGQDNAELAYWRQRAQQWLGHGGPADAVTLQALALVPELALLLPAYDGVALPAPAPEAAYRQSVAVLRLLQLFAVAARPLVLVLDDVQWLDIATVALLEEILEQARALPLLLLMTSRSGAAAPVEAGDEARNDADGEADAAPGKLPAPAQRLRLRARQGGAGRCVEIGLAPLTQPALATLLAEALQAQPAHMGELAALVHDKTAGNPYFVQQFMQTVLEEQWALRGDDGRWRFALDTIAALPYTDNVAELALARLARLPAASRDLLGGLACLGSAGDDGLLAALYGIDRTTLARQMAAAVDAGVVALAAAGHVFTHDRLQEVAYAELDADTRHTLHMRLGRLMAAQALASERDDLLFAAMDHVQRAPALLPAGECLHLAGAALLAARKARRACAYASALTYLELAVTLAGAAAGGTGMMDAHAASVQQLCFDAALERAHCHCFGGNLDAAQAMLPQLRGGPAARQVQGKVLRLAAEIAVRRGEYAQAVRHTLEGLRPFGIDMAELPSDAQCDEAYAALCARLHGDWAATLRQLPPLDAGEDIAVALSLLSGMLMPASFSSPRLLLLHLCHTLQLTLDHGISGEGVMALAWLGVAVADRYGHYEEGHAYAATARALATQHGYSAYAAPVMLALDQVSVWTQPLGYALECAQTGYACALAAGDLTMASFELCHRICMMVSRGDALDGVALEIARAREFVAQLEFRDMDKILLVQQQFVNHLRGVDDAPLLQGQVDEGVMVTLRFWHWVYQAGPAFLGGDNALALACLREADALAWSAPAHLHQMEYHLFSVMALCAAETPPAGMDRASQQAKIAGHLARLADWARVNPATFADKYAMAQAAVRSRAGDGFGALALYDEAIYHAQAHGYDHYAAFCHELAAAVCRRGGHGTGEQAHMRGAIAAYRRWGAMRRAGELEAQMAPALAAPARADAGAQTVSLLQTAEIRDIDSVIRAARALSEEIEVAPLVRALMTIALEHAGAQRGLLLRIGGDTAQLEARAVLSAGAVTVELGTAAPGPLDLPLTMLHTAMRTRTPVSVAAVPRAAPFKSDAYLQCYPRCHALCIPMLKQSRLVGVLYLENRVATAPFSSEQARVLLLLAAQAAVSLETAGLYAELLAENRQRREAEQALRESRAMLLQGEQINRSGSWTWDLSQATINGTPELSRIFGLADARPTLPLSIFVDALHPDDQPRVRRILDHAIASRRAYSMDYRVVDPDGKVRHLSCVGEPMAGTGGAVFVGTTVDVTARRAAEDSLRQAQAELARVARVTTVGQLTSAIAHEINQPLMSISSNAGASLRWLDRDPPQLERVRSGLQEIAAQSQRAGGIIRGLRALTRKGPQESTPCDLHETIRHIVDISRSELERHDISLVLSLGARSGWVDGDAVQLQQVLLNVVVNALDAMKAHRLSAARTHSLTITTWSEQNRIAVAIDDTGSGIDADSAARMFEPYYTTKDDGMGMGLAICRSIIEAHAGSIAAAPRQPHGCSISFRLPERA